MANGIMCASNFEWMEEKMDRQLVMLVGERYGVDDNNNGIFYSWVWNKKQKQFKGNNGNEWVAGALKRKMDIKT